MLSDNCRNPDKDRGGALTRLTERFCRMGVCVFRRRAAWPGRAASVYSRVDEYRRLARECWELACTVVTEEARSTLIEMARIWTRLAHNQDLAFPPKPTDTSRPVVQQQQQQPPRPKKDE
jgi:hypothetical protein